VTTIAGNSQLKISLHSIVAVGSSPLANITLVTLPSFGSLAPFAASQGVLTLDISGTSFVTPQNAAFASLTYTPLAYYSGMDSLSLLLCDTASTCVTALVSITVTSGSSLKPSLVSFTQILDGRSSLSPLDVVLLSGPEVSSVNLTKCVLTTAPSFGTVDLSVLGSNLTVVYVPSEPDKNDTFAYTICDNWGSCVLISTSIEYVNETIPPLCLGGIEILALGGLLGIESLDSRSASRFWFLADYMQFLAGTNIYGYLEPEAYAKFAACFSWANFDIPLALSGQGQESSTGYASVTQPQKTRHSREKAVRSYAEEAQLLNIPAPELLLYKLFFFSVIFFPALFLGMLFAGIGLCLRPSQYADFQVVNVEDGEASKLRKVVLKLQWWCLGFAYRVAYFAYFSFAYGMAGQFSLAITTSSTEKDSLFSLSTAVGSLSLVLGSISFPLLSYWWARRHGKRQDLFLRRTPFSASEKAEFEKNSELQQGRLLGPFIQHFKEEGNYFGLVVLGRKFLMGVFLGALQGSDASALASLSLSIVTVVAYLAVVAVTKPFRKIRYYLYEALFGTGELLILALLIALLKDPTNQILVTVLEALHYAVMTCFLVTCIPFIIYDIVQWRRQRADAKEEEYELGSRLASRAKPKGGSS